MHRFALIVAAVVLICLPVQASEPGEPLDCSDWVFMEPGLSCETEIAYPCMYDGTNQIRRACQGGGNTFDVGGDIFFLNEVVENDACGGVLNLRKYDIMRAKADGTETVVAHIEDRCVNATTADIIQSITYGFDRINGRLVVSNVNRSDVTGGPELYENGAQRMSIHGFPTLFEILQTYTPTTNEISFRTPYMPEGFQFADFFDTYYGNLATVGDWSQAQPFQCGYPATAPSVGDYLTADASGVPDPAPGEGVYFVTAVNFLGDRRYGRKRINGVLSGRDPAVLPACSE